MNTFTLSIDDCTIRSSTQGMSRGVILDSTLCFSSHTNNLSLWIAFLHLRNIFKLWLLYHNTPRKSWSMSSCINCCNAIMASIPDNLVHWLQLIDNFASRIITCSKSTEHVTPLLIQFHWLPVAQRINFKIVLLTSKALHNRSSLCHTPPSDFHSLSLLVIFISRSTGTTSHQPQHNGCQGLLQWCAQTLKLASPLHLHTALHVLLLMGILLLIIYFITDLVSDVRWPWMPSNTIYYYYYYTKFFLFKTHLNGCKNKFSSMRSQLNERAKSNW